MAIDPFSPAGLRQTKQDKDYAPHIKTWPPVGYVAPTEDEFDAIRAKAERHSHGGFWRWQWERMDNASVIRQLKLIELMREHNGKALLDYTHELRRVARERGITHTSIALLRCGACNHGTERLFEVTQDTHPGMTDRYDIKVDSAWFCARCWSGDDADKQEAGG